MSGSDKAVRLPPFDPPLYFPAMPRSVCRTLLGSLLAVTGCALGDRPPISPLEALVEHLAHEDPGTIVAVATASIGSPELRASAGFERNSRVRMHPASTLKLVTAAAAIDAGFLDRSLVTRLLADTQSTALLLEGAGDPLLTHEDLETMWRQAARAEIELDQTLLVDSSLFDGIPFGAGWMWDDEPAPFMPYVSALTVDSGVVSVVISRPVEHERDPFVLFDPPAPTFFSLDLKLDRVPAKTTTSVAITREVLGDRRTIRIEGPLAPGDRADASFSFPDPDLFTGEVLVSIADPARDAAHRARVVRVPRLTPEERSRFKEVARIDRPIEDVLRAMLKQSDNLAAECLLRLLAVHADPSVPGSAAGGTAVVARYLARLGFAPDDFTIVDGSGLSFYDSISAEILLAVLVDLAARPDFPRILELLPIAGVDGTLMNRFADSPAHGRVRAKTGTLAGVSGLAGYAETTDGSMRAFAFLAGEYTGSARPWRERLDALAEALTAPTNVPLSEPTR